MRTWLLNISIEWLAKKAETAGARIYIKKKNDVRNPWQVPRYQYISLQVRSDETDDTISVAMLHKIFLVKLICRIHIALKVCTMYIVWIRKMKWASYNGIIHSGAPSLIGGKITYNLDPSPPEILLVFFHVSNRSYGILSISELAVIHYH